MKNRLLFAYAFAVLCAQGAIEPLSPDGGEEVAMRPASQAELFNLHTQSERKKKGREYKKARTGLWKANNPVVFEWRADAGETGPWKVTLSLRKDFSRPLEFQLGKTDLMAVKEEKTGDGAVIYRFENRFANLLLGREYFWKVKGFAKDGKTLVESAAGRFKTALEPPRWIALEGRVKNMRDLGGWPAENGCRVRQGMVYRSQGLNDNSALGDTPGRNRLTVEDARYLKDVLGIKTELDLRKPFETASAGASPIGGGVRCIERKSASYATIFKGEHKKTMGRNIKVFADISNYPVVFHCIDGADRTGSLSYILLGLLGVEKENLEKEWESTFYPSIPTPDVGSDGKRYWKGTAYFDEGLAKYGDESTPLATKIERYLLDCGVTAEEIARIRSIMLEGRTAERPVPRPALAKRLAADEEIIALVHWGPDTYMDREWGYGDEDPAIVDPDRFDAGQIVGACKAGGACGIVLVAKHHDGFCLWPTKTTAHNISKSPFRGGKGDYVKEIEQACRKAGLKFGVYVSPWDRNNGDYAKEKYVEIYHEQLRELLSGDYGDIFEVWFDGANGGDGWYGGAKEKRRIPPGYYRFDEVFRYVREKHPGAVIFCGEEAAGDLRWPGNERGHVEPDSRATQTIDKFGQGRAALFRMIEADFPLRKGWIWHEKDRGKSKSAAYLMKIYLRTVGNGTVMNIGVAPDKNGLVDEEDLRSLAGFKTIKDAFFAHEVAESGKPFNVVVMREDLSAGEQVDGWEFLADGKPILSGKAIGNKRIRILENEIAPQKCEIKITASGGNVRGVSFKLYRADPELVKLVLESSTSSGETDTAKWMKAAGGID